MVNILKEHLKEPAKNVSILDVAAGTGFFGEGLAKAGFNNITALDYSAEMLEVASKRGQHNERVPGMQMLYAVSYHIVFSSQHTIQMYSRCSPTDRQAQAKAGTGGNWKVWYQTQCQIGVTQLSRHRCG